MPEPFDVKESPACPQNPQDPQDPQDPRELVAALPPGELLLFAHAGRLLRNTTRRGATRFLIGRAAPGCRSVLRDGDRWVAVHLDEHGGHATATAFDDARSATAHALAGLMAQEGVGLNTAILRAAGLIERVPAGDPSGGSDRGTSPLEWRLTDAGRRLAERAPVGASAGGRVHADLAAVAGHPFGYVTITPVAASEGHGPLIPIHAVFESFVRHVLPGAATSPSGESASTRETLEEGTELDSYTGADDVMAYTPETPFSRRALWGSAEDHRRHRYRVLRPLVAYRAFWYDTSTIPAGAEATARPARSSGSTSGHGHYLVHTIADLLRTGDLGELPAVRQNGYRIAWP